MTVSLQPLPQQPAPPPELGTLHILGFLPLSDVGCPPLAARYRVRPEASAGAGAGLGELPPLFPCLLDYLLGGRLAAEARSLCSRPGRAPPEPSEPSAAVVRTAGSMLGYLHTFSRAGEGVDGPSVHGLLLSMLHSTQCMPPQPHAPADADAVGAEQIQAQVERTLKCAGALPGKLEAACAAAGRVQRMAAVAGLPHVVCELRECVLSQQQGARSRAVGRGLDQVLAALSGQHALPG